MKLILISLIIIWGCLFSTASVGEPLGPGIYYRYTTTDRWGHRVFHAGPYHPFLSDEMVNELEKYTVELFSAKGIGDRSSRDFWP